MKKGKKAMAAFIFYCIEADYPLVVDTICQAGYGVIPTWFENPNVEIQHGYTPALARGVETNKTLHIIGGFSRSGVPLYKVRGKYAVSILHSGPLINLKLPIALKDGDGINVVGGDLSYQPWYFDEGGAAVRPSTELKGAYRRIVKEVKSQCLRVDLGRQIYVSESLGFLLANGTAKVRVLGQFLGL